MTRSASRPIANMEGETALPRKSGELVFHDSWERRAFAMAVALCEQGLYPWDDFRDRLIAEIAMAERHGEASSYYERWLASFEKLLIEKRILTKEEFDARAAKLDSSHRR
jgi:nitrile hydratase accessory protein